MFLTTIKTFFGRDAAMIRNAGLFVLLLVLSASHPAEAGMSYIKATTFVNPSGTEVKLSMKVYIDGEKVRVEEDAKQIEGNPGVHIYDFEKKRVYTILDDIKLYMEDTLSVPKEAVLQEEQDPQTLKKYTEAKDIRVEKNRKEDVPIQGHPTTHHEIKIVQKKTQSDGTVEEKVLENYATWVREDLGNMTVRYEFEFSNKSRKVVEYLDIETQDFDPGLFKVPEGYVRVQPY
jgi:IMP dehydrogenase/GMP reductase